MSDAPAKPATTPAPAAPPPPSDFVNIEINGVAMQARKGEMIIRATDRQNVYVPRFCYHEKLPVAANCRMCLVEVEKAPKPLPACATPVAEGMKIFTKSAKAIGAQKAVMEFLLINHPLDCPICDQGGECELQDLAVGYGRDISRYSERKRVVKDHSIGPLVSTDMTRCIHCTRCVRFGQDVAGIQELGTIGRGEQMQIGTCIEQTVDHELSGNIIDLCPVGALNSKPFRFHARAWEMSQAPLVSPHDGIGSNLYGHVLRGKLMRVVPRPAEDINETWISDRDRFSYQGIYSEDRVQTPLLRQPDGSLKAADWETALATAAAGLKSCPADQLGLLAHPSSTLEELHLLARLGEGLGTANIDHRLRLGDTRLQGEDERAPGLGLPLAQVDALDSLLVIGSDLRNELPLLAHRVRKAARRGARVAFVNPLRHEYLFPVAGYLQAADLRAELAGLLAAALARSGAIPGAEAAALVGGVSASAAQLALAEQLLSGTKRAVWLGALALRSSQYGELRRLARALATILGASLGELAEGGNAVGASLAGVTPHRGAAGAVRDRVGLDAGQMLSRPLGAYVLVNVEPGADTAQATAVDSLAGARCVVALATHMSGELARVAHVVLPISSFAETSGTWVNLEGRWQSVAGAARPVGEARPGWKVLRALGSLMDIAGFEYQSSDAVRDELRARVEVAPKHGYASVRTAGAAGGVPTPGRVALYDVDAIVRRADALQLTRAARTGAAAGGEG